MKNKLKFVSIIALIATSLVALGDQLNPKLIATGWTNRIAGSTSSATNDTYVDIGGLKNVAVQVRFQMLVGGTTNQTTFLGLSSDRGQTNVIPIAALVIAANGTSWATGGTNLVNNGFKYLVVRNQTNAFATAAHYMTNHAVIVSGN